MVHLFPLYAGKFVVFVGKDDVRLLVALTHNQKRIRSVYCFAGQSTHARNIPRARWLVWSNPSPGSFVCERVSARMCVCVWVGVGVCACVRACVFV